MGYPSMNDWTVSALSFAEWENYWSRCSPTNLLQSWQYGVAKEQSEHWGAHRFLVGDAEGRPAALVQVLSRELPLIGGIARINRGPLLLADLPVQDAEIVMVDALRALLQEARRRRWWMVQVAPELPNNEKVSDCLQRIGLRRHAGVAWASGRLALSVDENTLLMGFNGKWRNCMRKGERLGVEILRCEVVGPELERLVNVYSELKQDKGFEGLPEDLLRSLALQWGNTWEFDLFIARDSNMPLNEDPIGMLVSIRHGDTATYLIGSTNAQGRRMQANSVLLWQAILHAKRTGCAWFDIGGLNEATPKGIAEFKQGLNAVPYALSGEWRWYSLPWCLPGTSKKEVYSS